MSTASQISLPRLAAAIENTKRAAQFWARPVDQTHLDRLLERETARQAHPRTGEKIVTDYWRKPGPTNKFDWSAHFDNDEPNDDGQMSVGYGATEQDAIDDLLTMTEDA